jgi:hypothetical protein
MICHSQCIVSQTHRLCADCGRLCELVADLAGELSAEARSERADDARADDGECTSFSWRAQSAGRRRQHTEGQHPR